MPKTYEDIRDCSLEELKHWLETGALKVNERYTYPKQSWNTGLTPLHVAAEHGVLEKVKILLDAGAQINAKDSFFLNTPLHLHLAGTQCHTEMIKLLLNAGAQINATDRFLNTPLHVTGVKGYTEAAHELLNAGAQTEAVNQNQFTPLHLALLNRHHQVVKVLIKAGAQIEAKDAFGNTPLHLAGEKGLTEGVQALLNAGAQIEAVNQNQYTPLHYAALKGYVEVVQLLLGAGAQIGAKDHSQHTPLHYAKQHGHQNVVDVLNTFRQEIVPSLRKAISGGALVGMKQQLQQQHPSSLNTIGKGLASLPDEALMQIGGWVAKLGDRNDPGSLARVSKSALEGAKGERQKVLGKWTAKLEEERAQQGGEKGK